MILKSGRQAGSRGGCLKKLGVEGGWSILMNYIRVDYNKFDKYFCFFHYVLV